MDARALLWLWSASIVVPQVEMQAKRTFDDYYRPNYHISAPLSWLNYPSGFTIFNRRIHIFYQYHPYHISWGLMRWGHLSSKNLIDWDLHPTALQPDQPYDRHGCLSGTALTYNDHLTLIYTGSGSKNFSEQTQNIAISPDGYVFKKYLYNPLIRESPIFDKGFRSPKVWQNNDTWYMVVGSTSKQEHGQLLLYTASSDLFNWQFNGTLVDSKGDMGYMWESPDIFSIDGNIVLMISAQGIKSDGYRFKNLFQTGYVITSSFDYETARFTKIEVSTDTYHELDFGHDFYAAQTLNTKDDRILLVAWLGMWGNEFREVKYRWAGMLTILRELGINSNGKILMNPVREMTNLRVGVMEDTWYYPGELFFAETKSFELLINSSASLDVVIEFDWGESSGFKIGYSSKRGQVTIDRGGVDGIRRADWAPQHDIFFRIFVDSSSIEIFCGEGEVVFSSRIYPNKLMFIKLEGESRVHVKQYRLRRTRNYYVTFPIEEKLDSFLFN